MTLYHCPICNTPLDLQDSSYRCEKNHSFDKAKEGYVNLLPVQFKQSKQPGDNKAMVNARREFLEQGYYLPLQERIVALFTEYLTQNTALLDAGCGEGNYTEKLTALTSNTYGVDIAKEAIKKAAKKYKHCQFSVATLSKLPFDDNTFSGLLSVYAPILEVEFTRVLQKDGILITVTPGKQHLHQLKAQIYRQATEHDEQRTPIENMTLVHQEKVNYEMTLNNGQAVLQLLSMTPFAFKATEEVKEYLSQQAAFACQADFLIKVYKNSNCEA